VSAGLVVTTHRTHSVDGPTGGDCGLRSLRGPPLWDQLVAGPSSWRPARARSPRPRCRGPRRSGRHVEASAAGQGTRCRSPWPRLTHAVGSRAFVLERGRQRRPPPRGMPHASATCRLWCWRPRTLPPPIPECLAARNLLDGSVSDKGSISGFLRLRLRCGPFFNFCFIVWRNRPFFCIYFGSR